MPRLENFVMDYRDHVIFVARLPIKNHRHTEPFFSETS